MSAGVVAAIRSRWGRARALDAHHLNSGQATHLTFHPIKPPTLQDKETENLEYDGQVSRHIGKMDDGGQRGRIYIHSISRSPSPLPAHFPAGTTCLTLHLRFTSVAGREASASTPYGTKVANFQVTFGDSNTRFG